MFEKIRSFLYRHRRKLMVGSLVLGGAVVLSRYIQRALREWHERETKAILERARKQQHFEDTERTCNQTALAFLPRLRDTIERLTCTSELIEELKSGSSNKIAIWENLKILAFAKITFLIYVTSMLMVILRIQLNVIGGYMYRDNTENSGETVSSAVQEKYLSQCDILLKNGGQKLYELIHEKVTLLLQDKSLKEKMTVQDIEQLLWSVHAAISEDSNNPVSTLPQYVFPVNADQEAAKKSAIYNRILLETQEILENEEISSLLKSCVSRGFSYVMDNVSQYYVSSAQLESNNNPQPGTSASTDPFFSANISSMPTIVDITKVSIPLAKIIPIINGFVAAQNYKSTDVLQKWMQQLILMDNLKTMGANMYEAFSSS